MIIIIIMFMILFWCKALIVVDNYSWCSYLSLMFIYIDINAWKLNKSIYNVDKYTLQMIWIMLSLRSL